MARGAGRQAEYPALQLLLRQKAVAVFVQHLEAVVQEEAVVEDGADGAEDLLLERLVAFDVVSVDPVLRRVLRVGPQQVVVDDHIGMDVAGAHGFVRLRWRLAEARLALRLKLGLGPRLGGGLGGLAAARAVARGDGQHLVLLAALVLPPLASSLKFGLLRSAGVGTAARWFCLAGRQGCSGGFRRVELLGR